tara:strand:- start:4212 stop:4379 length:168 start_codon:yes stop_codon:yes gene_type:complete
MRKKKAIEIAVLNKNSSKKTYKTRKKVGERPINIRKQREILKRSNKWNSEEGTPT